MHELQKKLADLNAASMRSDNPEIINVTSSEEKCTAVMSNLRRGYWDINIKRADEVKLILGSEEKPNSQFTTKTNLVGKAIPAGSLEAWRTLKLGMSESNVRKLLGEPENVEVISDFAKWEYSNNGGIVFQSMIVKAWKEPSFPKKDARQFGSYHGETYITDNAGDRAREQQAKKQQSLYHSLLQKMGLDSPK